MKDMERGRAFVRHLKQRVDQRKGTVRALLVLELSSPLLKPYRADTSLLMWNGGDMLAEHDFGAWVGKKIYQPLSDFNRRL